MHSKQIWVRLVVAVALILPAGAAEASQAQDAVDQASAALAQKPPDRTAARNALDRAIAAADDPVAVNEAYFRLGAIDEDEQAFARAVAHYQQCVASKPPGRAVWARNASQRLSWLNERAEGEFAPLAYVEAFKRDPMRMTGPAEIDKFAHDVDGFPPGLVRVEARLLAAELLLNRRPGDAIRLYREVNDDPRAQGQARRFGELGLVTALLRDGQLDAAAHEVDVYEAMLPHDLVRQVHQQLRRRTLLLTAKLVLAAFGVFMVIRMYLRRRRQFGPDPLRKTATWLRVVTIVGLILSVKATVYLVYAAVAPQLLERFGI